MFKIQSPRNKSLKETDAHARLTHELAARQHTVGERTDARNLLCTMMVMEPMRKRVRVCDEFNCSTPRLQTTACQ
jgi:hypothetical protein